MFSSSMNAMQLQENPHWKALATLQQKIHLQSPTSCIEQHYSCGLTLDLSRQHLTQETFDALKALAQSLQLNDNIEAMFNGEIVNYSEQRAALHTALRDPKPHERTINGENIFSSVQKSIRAMYSIATKLRTQTWLADHSSPITDIVNIGVGGSDLGPKFCTQALQKFHCDSLNFHFISDADPLAFESVVNTLRPENTLFIISSKSFTTPETLFNYQKARTWVKKNHWTSHFIAVTANTCAAREAGFEHIVAIWPWVGGRYSVTSASNLIMAIAIGPEAFQAFLDGAHAMDCHFRKTPIEKNLPQLAALVGVWNNNFLQATQHLILSYGQPLDKLVQYVQQLEMESNGKSVDIYGNSINYSTAPVVWGGPGNQAQHSYYQLLCQGTHQIAIELVSSRENHNHMINAMCQNKTDILYHGVQNTAYPYQRIKGNVPVTRLQLDTISPYSMGALIAFYEHKVFTQSVIWRINPFDQPGVESAKKNLRHQVSAALV